MDRIDRLNRIEETAWRPSTSSGSFILSILSTLLLNFLSA
jgi:hypothetical protein